MTPESTHSWEVASQILIVQEGHHVPFSKGLLAQSLTATGLAPDRAYRVALQVEAQLRDSGMVRVPISYLPDLVARVLEEQAGSLYQERYHKWQQLSFAERPVIILVGGATGVGKSTLASQLANRMGFVRIISSDTIRQVMRAFFSRTLMPAIHYSSFDAGRAVQMPLEKGANPHLLGFVEQVKLLSVGTQAVVDRAVKEGQHMVVEGVHLVPGYNPACADTKALLLPLVVAVRDEDLHRSHFLVRERETDGRRPVDRYMRNFAQIRKIQDFILERAEDEGTLVIENLNIDQAVGTVVDALYGLIEADKERRLPNGAARHA